MSGSAIVHLEFRTFCPPRIRTTLSCIATYVTSMLEASQNNTSTCGSLKLVRVRVAADRLSTPLDAPNFPRSFVDRRSCSERNLYECIRYGCCRDQSVGLCRAIPVHSRLRLHRGHGVRSLHVSPLYCRNYATDIWLALQKSSLQPTILVVRNRKLCASRHTHSRFSRSFS